MLMIPMQKEKKSFRFCRPMGSEDAARISLTKLRFTFEIFWLASIPREIFERLLVLKWIKIAHHLDFLHH